MEIDAFNIIESWSSKIQWAVSEAISEWVRGKVWHRRTLCLLKILWWQRSIHVSNNEKPLFLKYRIYVYGVEENVFYFSIIFNFGSFPALALGCLESGQPIASDCTCTRITLSTWRASLANHQWIRKKRHNFSWTPRTKLNENKFYVIALFTSWNVELNMRRSSSAWVGAKWLSGRP